MEKKIPLASAQFEKAVAIGPTNAEALAGMALIMRLQGQGDQAIGRIQAALSTGESAELTALLGKTYLSLGQYDLAEKSLQRALQMDQQDFSIYVDLANLYTRKKSLHKATGQLEDAVRMNPKSVGLWTTLGVLYEAENQPQLARAA